MVVRQYYSDACPVDRNLCGKSNSNKLGIFDRWGQIHIRRLDFLADCACKMFTGLFPDISKLGKQRRTTNKDNGVQAKPNSLNRYAQLFDLLVFFHSILAGLEST